MSYTPEPLQPRAALQLLQRRAEAEVRVDQAGPWRATWFPVEAEVKIADGLSLGEANALALFSSPRVRRARADARVAGAQVLQAGVLANPELFLGPRMSTQDSKVIFPAGIGWELPLWGKHNARREEAEARLTESRLGVIEVEVETLGQVRTLFLRLARLQREEAVLAAVAASSRQIVEWVEGLRTAREVDAMAVFLARTERDEGNVALENTRAETVRTRRDLFLLLGLLPDAPVKPVVDAAVETLPSLTDPDADTLLRVPALRAAEANYASAEAALRLEISKQYPTIRLGPEFEDDRGDSSVGFGLGMTLPLFDRNKGGIAAAEESRRRAREEYHAALLRAAHAEAVARERLATARRLLQIHRDGAMRDAAEASRALEIRLRAGRADVVEVLAAQRAIARTRVRVLELEEQIEVASLRAAVAGGLALQRPAEAKGKEKKQ